MPHDEDTPRTADQRNQLRRDNACLNIGTLIDSLCFPAEELDAVFPFQNDLVAAALKSKVEGGLGATLPLGKRAGEIGNPHRDRYGNTVTDTGCADLIQNSKAVFDAVVKACGIKHNNILVVIIGFDNAVHRRNPALDLVVDFPDCIAEAVVDILHEFVHTVDDDVRHGCPFIVILFFQLQQFRIILQNVERIILVFG